MTLFPVKRERMVHLDELLEIEYEKLAEFQKELAISASANAKFELRQRLKREVLPAIRSYEAEYAGLLAGVADVDSIPDDEAAAVTTELVQAVQCVESLPDSNRPDEITKALAEIKQKLDEPGKVAAARLKVSLPIIPLIASYEMEMNTEASLTVLWRRIKSLFGGET